MSKQSHSSSITVGISLIHTPEVIITVTQKKLLEKICTTVENGILPEPVTVVYDNGVFCAVDNIEILEAALKLGLEKIKINVIESKHDPLATHIIKTWNPAVNPLRKIRAIKKISESMKSSERFLSDLRLSDYDIELLNIRLDQKVAAEFEKTIDMAIQRDISPRLPLLFFSKLAETENPLRVISEINDIVKDANKNNFIWSTNIFELISLSRHHKEVKRETRKIPFGDGRKFECGCGQEFWIDEKSVCRIAESSESYDLVSPEGDVSKPAFFLSSQALKHIGGKPMFLSFPSIDKATKKFGDKKFPIIIIADRDILEQ